MDTTLSKRAMMFQKFADKPLNVFALFWGVTFALYLPAAKAGMIGDFPGWLYTIRNADFWDFVNRPDSTSLYQFTQLVTYGIYKIIGISPWAWHVLMVTMHAINCLLLFMIGKRLFEDSRIKNGGIIAFGGILLFCFTPYNTENIVHESCYHYLQGFLILLLIVRWAQQFHHTPSAKYAVWSVLLYAPSTYSLEVFYITPLLVLTLAIYYRHVLHYDQAIFKKVCKWFFLPMLLFYIAHVIVLRLIVHTYIGHNGFMLTGHMWMNYLGKPLRYLFHILLLGRYMPLNIKEPAYVFCASVPAIVAFYVIIMALTGSFVYRYQSLGIKTKLGALLFVWAFFAMAIVVPQDFSGLQYVVFDRYTYFMMPFIFWVMLLLFSSLKSRSIGITIFAVYSMASIFFTIKTNFYWKRSAYIVKRLVNDLPDTTSKPIILLNIPENMNGILMIGSQPISVTKLSHNLYAKKQMTNTVYDVASYNMTGPGDGAHVMVINDTMVRVTLNQWHTWWWYRYMGAHSYQNEAYKLDMVDEGHWYNLILKHPIENYQLLYVAGDQWKAVDATKKNADQY